MNTRLLCAQVDAVFDALLARLDISEGPDAILISHWQEGSRPGFRLQVTRKSDGRSLTKFVSADGTIHA